MPAALTRAETDQNLAELKNLLAGELTAAAPLPEQTVQDAPSAASWINAVRGKTGTLRHPRIAFFCLNGGAGAAQLAELQAAETQTVALAGIINSDLQVYEVPASRDIGDALHAVAYGMTAVQAGLDILGLACLGDDNFESLPPTLDALLASDRADLAALLGAALAARLARVPVVGDGRAFSYVMTLLQQADAAASRHMVVAADLIGRDETDIPPRVAAAMAYLKSATALKN